DDTLAPAPFPDTVRQHRCARPFTGLGRGLRLCLAGPCTPARHPRQRHTRYRRQQAGGTGRALLALTTIPTAIVAPVTRRRHTCPALERADKGRRLRIAQ